MCLRVYFLGSDSKCNNVQCYEAKCSALTVHGSQQCQPHFLANSGKCENGLCWPYSICYVSPTYFHWEVHVSSFLRCCLKPSCCEEKSSTAMYLAMALCCTYPRTYKKTEIITDLTHLTLHSCFVSRFQDWVSISTFHIVIFSVFGLTFVSSKMRWSQHEKWKALLRLEISQW